MTARSITNFILKDIHKLKEIRKCSLGQVYMRRCRLKYTDRDKKNLAAVYLNLSLYGERKKEDGGQTK